MTEPPQRIEPCIPDTLLPEIVDRVAVLADAAARLGGRLHFRTAANLADLVRVMNCYYSNLIEGHNTRPHDIEQALQSRFDTSDPKKRNLQMEAVSHIRIQKKIDVLHASGTLPEPSSIEFIQWLHREFYIDLPESMRILERDGKTICVIPGKFRQLPLHDVAVGRHLPPSSTSVDAFMNYFESRFDTHQIGKGMQLAALASAHHRFNYIHPFPDGNGRVSRLMSHAMALRAGIGAHGLWSVSRGLARGINSPNDYMIMMDMADMPRQGDLDGRGNLSMKALNTFIGWFLDICIDQIAFMQQLFDLESLATRLSRYCSEQNWKPEAFTILEMTLLKGELTRGDACRITNLKERSARSLLSSLLENGILGSDSPKGPVSLRFPAAALDHLFPNLFPAHSLL
ncbi:MAG: Fic family protein [Chlorobiaceae bacterium]|nr:Fic family protein [Chlorobiaceae bacterium]NTV61081.1 Fic family protein [Chlorobiaceae bacterium]